MQKIAESEVATSATKLDKDELVGSPLPRKHPQLQDSLTAVILDTNADKEKEKEKKVEQEIDLPPKVPEIVVEEKDCQPRLATTGLVSII